MWKCHKCGKPVYFAERKQSLGYDWHPECLRCEECGKRLNPGQHAEHKGVPYCHVPCYGALFGPQLFGHGTRVESHKNFGQKGTPRVSSGPVLPRDHLENKLKIYNQFFDNKSMEIRSREVNNRLVLEGALRVYWGVHGVIHLKEDDDQRTVVTVRKRNSCRYGNVVEIKNVDEISDKENDNTDTGIDSTTCSAMDGYSTDISMSESITFDSCSISEDVITEPTDSSSNESSPKNNNNNNNSISSTLPTKLDVKDIKWDEIDDLLQVERKIDESEKLYQTMPATSFQSQSSNENIAQKQTQSNNVDVDNDDESNVEIVGGGANDNIEQKESIDSEDTLKAMDFEDFKRSIHEEYINGTNCMDNKNENDTLKSNQPIDPSRINDSLKLYGDNVMSKSFNCETALRKIDTYSIMNDVLTLKNENNYYKMKTTDSRGYGLQKSCSASSKYSPVNETNAFLEKGINRSKSGPNCFLNTTDSDEEATLKASTIRKSDFLSQSNKYINIKMDCYDDDNNDNYNNRRPSSEFMNDELKIVENQIQKDNHKYGIQKKSEIINFKDSESESYTANNHVTEDGVILRRPPKTGASAIKRRSGNKRSRTKLKRRCSINGHFYNRETSFFTPPHGSQMSVWVTSLVNTQEVINLLLEKYKVDSRPENFALFVVRDNGEQKRLRDDDYPLVVRVMLGPHEDVARIFLMDSQETQEISSEVAQFLNLSLPECRAIIDRYNEELNREVIKIKEKYAEMRRRIIQRMESLKVRL